MTRAVAALLDDGRLHLQHGPIDLIIAADGAPDEVAAGFGQARARFDGLLESLVRELPLLRSPAASHYPLAQDPVARRMVAAVWPHRHTFITPMAAVAGAVADEMLTALIAGRQLARAYVNDGGDIALHLTRGTSFRIGVVGSDVDAAIDGIATIDAASPVRGIATSGWGGRSLSLGIADAATVLARTGAAADAAATLVANACNTDHAAIVRRPAREVVDDSDLGDLPVTVSVGALAHADIARALDAGAAEADRLYRAGLIEAAMLVLRKQTRVVGRLALRAPPARVVGDP
ncbi:MAG: UPF0280 family protein [Alphaproteobacteria bacterium]|nr:UPF0280 family protein [Alphaproteobacteria bacterium]